MDVYLTADDRKRGLARAIYERIREAIAEGRMRPGEQLPPSRELAEELGISRFTVTTAYGYLVSEGFLEGSSGAGTRVAEVQPSGARHTRKVTAPFGPLVQGAPMAMDAAPALDLRLGTPDATLFPQADFRRQVARAMRDLRGPGPGLGDAAGDPVLRAAIAVWIHRSRGVRATADQIVITAGAQQAFDLVLCALAEPGDVVAVEDPGYLPFRRLCQIRGVKIAAVPVDGEGIVASALPPRAKLVYVTPSHQFPMGAALSLARRRQLLDWARATGAAILEDDYDSEFRFTERPLEPLQRLERDGRVIYIGSFSKTLSPALRLGFIVAPGEWASSIARLRQLMDWHSPTLLQRALGRFLAEGEMDRHLRRARRAYRIRHQMLVDWCAGPGRKLGALFASGAGLHVAVELRDDVAPSYEAELIARAGRAGLALEGLSSYCIDAQRPGLGIGFGTATPAELERAFQIVSKLVPK